MVLELRLLELTISRTFSGPPPAQAQLTTTAAATHKQQPQQAEKGNSHGELPDRVPWLYATLS